VSNADTTYLKKLNYGEENMTTIKNKLKAECPICVKKTTFEVLEGMEVEGKDDEHGRLMSELYKCRTCNTTLSESTIKNYNERFK
jgi:hypothetical protein